MRGTDPGQEGMFSYVSPEARVPADHPLRAIRKMVNRALEGLTREFEVMYSHTGRPSIAPEQLLRALLLQVLYSIRSERLLVEQLDYNLLFRWFVGLSMDDRVWDHSTFTKNRERLIGSDIARAFFGQVLGQAREGRLLSDEHFSVDGTLLEAWASMKSFRPKDGGGRPGGGGRNAEADFHGEKRSNATHQSSTDPQARLYRKGQGQEAKLCYLGHALMDNCHGLIVDTRTTEAGGRAEREAGLATSSASRTAPRSSHANRTHHRPRPEPLRSPRRLREDARRRRPRLPAPDRQHLAAPERFPHQPDRQAHLRRRRRP